MALWPGWLSRVFATGLVEQVTWAGGLWVEGRLLGRQVPRPEWVDLIRKLEG